jgi:hypothetical protein
VLPVNEFREVYVLYHRRARWIVAITLASLLVAFGFILSSLLDSRGSLGGYLRPLVPEFVVKLLATAISVVAIVPGALLALWFYGHLARHESRLVCPHCDRGLALSLLRVVASRTCPRCEREILADPIPAEPAPLSREEAELRSSRWKRFYWWIRVESVLILLVLCCTHILNAEGTIPERTGEFLEAVLICVVLAWAVWVGIKSRRLQQERVLCPRCCTPHEPGFVVKFERCGGCSQPLIAGPEPTSASVDMAVWPRVG